MKTRIKTGKVSLVVFIAVMAVCVAGVAIWCYAVGHQVKEHRQGGHGFVIFLIFWYLFCNQVLL